MARKAKKSTKKCKCLKWSKNKVKRGPGRGKKRCMKRAKCKR